MENRCKKLHEYDQEAEDQAVEELIIQREEEENLQREAEQRLEAEQAERAAEDARLRELYLFWRRWRIWWREFEDELSSENNGTENTKENENHLKRREHGDTKITCHAYMCLRGKPWQE